MKEKLKKVLDYSKSHRLIAALTVVAILCGIVAVGAFVQRWAYEANEAKKPIIILEANATIDNRYDLTGELEFSAYVKTPGDEPFSSVSFVAGYSDALTPCDVDGTPLPLNGTTIPMPTITTEGFISTAVAAPGANARGGLIYMTITAEDVPVTCDGEFPLATIKFRYDKDQLRPWADDEKNGPYWVESDTSLIWFADVEDSAAAPWHCRLLYSSDSNLYYSTDADHESVYVPSSTPVPDETYAPVRDDTAVTPVPTESKATIAPTMTQEPEPTSNPNGGEQEEMPEGEEIIRGSLEIAGESDTVDFDVTEVEETPVLDNDIATAPDKDGDGLASAPVEPSAPIEDREDGEEGSENPSAEPTDPSDAPDYDEQPEEPEGEEAIPAEPYRPAAGRPVADSAPVPSDDIEDTTPIAPIADPLEKELVPYYEKQGSGANYTSVAPGWNFKSNMLSYDDTRTTPQSDNKNKIRVRLVNEPTAARSIAEKGGGDVTIMFYNWDNSLLGVTSVPADEDAREAVSTYIETNFVHPSLRDKPASAMSRADTYKGIYDGTGVSGDDYPLTALSDYVFLKRPMTIVRDNVWEQRVGPSGTWDYDERYPYAYGWAIVEDINNPEFTPSVFGIGELADWAGADPETGAYASMSGKAPRLNVSPVGFSSYVMHSGKPCARIDSDLPNNIVCDTPLETDFHFANFNFSRMAPPVSTENALDRVVPVKACFEPGPLLREGNYELEQSPYYTKGDTRADSLLAASNEGADTEGTFKAELAFTRYIAKGDYSVPLMREPTLATIGINPYIWCESITDTTTGATYPLRFTQEAGLEYQDDSGQWLPRNLPPDAVYTDMVTGEKTVIPVADHPITERYPSIWGGYENDITSGTSLFPSGSENTVTENGGYECALNLMGNWEIQDYAITDVYGKDVWTAKTGKLRSVTNETYRDTCQWWKDYFGEHPDHYTHYDHCWYIHAYAPYIIPPYVLPVDKENGGQLKYNFGPDQIIPAYWLVWHPDANVPPENMDPNYGQWVHDNGRINLTEWLDGLTLYHDKDSVAIGSTIVIPYDTHMPYIVQIDEGYDTSLIEVDLDIHKQTISVKGLALGETDLTVSLAGYRTYDIHIKVVPEIDRLEIPDAHVIAGKDVKLEAIKYPTDTENDVVVRWSSSDPETATVDGRGRVKGIKPGYVTITATCGSERMAELKLSVRGQFTVTAANRWEIGYMETGGNTKNLVIPAMFVRQNTGDPEIDGTEWEVTKIDSWAFYGCKNLESVFIEDDGHIHEPAFSISRAPAIAGIQNIGISAFAYCPNLQTVRLPNTLVYIQDHAFQGCTSLVGPITVPKNTTHISEMAFEGIDEIIYSGVATGSPWGAKKVTHAN